MARKSENTKRPEGCGNPENNFKTLYDVIIRLRSPGGCPWDREQTPLSLRGCLIEETFECVEAINNKNPAHIREELGDLFLVAVMISYMHEQENKFSTADVLQTVSEKLIRRHPHVFSETWGKDNAETLSSAQVLENWAKIKAEQEGRKQQDSVLDTVGSGLPPLERAWKLQKKAAKAGFDWPDINGVFKKVREEFNEMFEAVLGGQKDTGNPDTQKNIEEELGDLLFSVVNLCRFLNIEPSVALHRTNNKFIHRFKFVEKKMKETGREMKPENLDIMDQYWNEAKGITV